jgi:Kef-type K+ transport system membrane component KefB
VVAVAVALSVDRLGMTAILGAALVGVAIPNAPAGPSGPVDPWAPPVATVSALGRALVPVFFVATGITVFTGSSAAATRPLIVLAVVLGMAGKVGGGYLGARLGGEPGPVA